MTKNRIVTGQFQYATRGNIQFDCFEGMSFVADTVSLSAKTATLEITFPKDQNVINAGDPVAFRFQNAEGQSIEVKNARILQTHYARNLSGILTAIGQDCKGQDMALLLDFDAVKPLPAGRKFEPEISNAAINCFAGDTWIETDQAPKRAKNLEKGDLISTHDHGLQRILWIGKKEISKAQLSANPELRPIRIAANSLGTNTPSTDLIVSPQHRIFIQSAMLKRMFDTSQVLVAAQHLTDIDGIEIDQTNAPIAYVNFVLENHELVYANGAIAESMLVGTHALKSMELNARNEFLKLFPELLERNFIPRACRHIVTTTRSVELAIRHRMGNKPLFISQPQ